MNSNKHKNDAHVRMTYPDGGGDMLETPSANHLPQVEPPNAADCERLNPDLAARESTLHQLVFDASDLVQYFDDNRLPTGIQRVQIEIITSVFESASPEYSLSIACFTASTSAWVSLDDGIFRNVCKLALAGGDLDDRNWQQALKQLRAYIDGAPPLMFRTGAFLINLGTSWWLPNYFLKVRFAKTQYGIRYVPFVHDCIPIITPEHCINGLTRHFIAWMVGAFDHADFFLANSKATAADLVRIAEYVGKKVAPPSVIRLNASFNKGRKNPSTANLGELFIKNDLRANDYVLLVATIESRKNHLLAFSAWITLLKKFGPRQVPKLVCVGKKGWLAEPVYAKLEASSLLREKVVMLTDVSDPVLSQLYYNCRFTIYPSMYEGWGLPVTESLCFGKVPLVSRASSLPEAGEDFAEYFDLESEADFVGKLERLIFDAEYREAMERWIVAGFRPRSWLDISAELLGLVRKWANSHPCDPEQDFRPAEARLGQYYPLSAIGEQQFWPGIVPGEVFRQGDAWWWPESWGCWTKHKVARLSFVTRPTHEKAGVLFLGIRGLEKGDCKVTITVKSLGTRQVSIKAKEYKWVIFRASKNEIARLKTGDYAAFDILLWSDCGVDFSEVTGGLDTRISSIGVLGFMFCAEDDFAAQLKIIAGVTLNDLDSLVAKPTEAHQLLLDAKVGWNDPEVALPKPADADNLPPGVGAAPEIGADLATPGAPGSNGQSRKRRSPYLLSKTRQRVHPGSASIST
jgi:glycosyltransferase involved in cell wall biosynthesis